jgi:hypothetical protein
MSGLEPVRVTRLNRFSFPWQGPFAAAAFCLSLVPARARAEDGPAAVTRTDAGAWRALGSLSFGRGLRFNNPYRLATPLGKSAESVSLSATYLDLGAGLLAPALPGLEHGATVDALFALDGINQFGLTPSYLMQFTLAPELWLHARVGIPFVITPDTSLGLEAGVGPRLALGWGLSLTAELVGSVFFGAATEEKSVTTIPMLSFQLGVCFDHSVLW